MRKCSHTSLSNSSYDLFSILILAKLISTGECLPGYVYRRMPTWECLPENVYWRKSTRTTAAPLAPSYQLEESLDERKLANLFNLRNLGKSLKINLSKVGEKDGASTRVKTEDRKKQNMKPWIETMEPRGNRWPGSSSSELEEAGKGNRVWNSEFHRRDLRTGFMHIQLQIADLNLKTQQQEGK